MNSIMVRHCRHTLYDLRSSPCWNSIWRRCFGRGHQKAMEVMIKQAEDRGNNRVDGLLCHSGCQYLHHRLLPAIINFLSQSDGDSYHHFHQKNLDVPFWQIYQYMKLCLLPVLYTVPPLLCLHYLALQHHSCIVILVASMKYCLQFACRQNVKTVFWVTF